jgi:hypothetical protein
MTINCSGEKVREARPAFKFGVIGEKDKKQEKD